jgi:hypothetical protein
MIGPLEDAERIRFTVLLRQRPDGPPSHDLEHWQNTPPAKRRYLSTDEFFQSYGATEDDVAATVDFLTSEHLHVIESHSGKRRIEVEGTPAHVNAAFGITLNRYRAPQRSVSRRIEKRGERPIEVHASVAEHVHRGFEGPVYLPAKLVGIVTAVIGLDDRRLGGPAGTGTGDPAGAQYLSPVTVAQLYNFPKSSAAGQTIGLFEAADQGAAYLHSDITDFISSLPAGANTQPHLADIGLLGYGNNTTLVTGGPPFGGGVIEATLDVAVVAATAQGSNINVYFTEDSENGWVAFLDRAIFPHAGDNPPSVISASWVLTFSDDTGTIGNPFVSGTLANTLSGYLQSAAMRGITVFMAIGDWGSGNQIVDTHCHVSYPNSDPWVTSCGGTIIGDISSSAPVTFEEFTWSDGNTASQFQSGVYEATGGGVSDTFPIPPYQTAAGLLPISKNDGNIRRGVPDVAGMVGMDGFFFNGSGGPGTNQLFGTSAVSPLYAGLVGVINAFLGHNVGFLNPTLYTFGPEICNDITFGDNDSSYTPDPPFYTADIGWDPCTGWGSINGLRLLAALAPAPVIETAIPSGGFGNACVGAFVDETLTINNSGFAMLLISNIIVSPSDFLAPDVTSYPLAVAPGSSIEVVIRFRPGSIGFKTGTVTIVSNNLFGLHKITVSGTAQAPRLVLAIAAKGDFGHVCAGSFADEPLILNNSGKCLLSVTSITSSSSDFVVPEVLHYPISIGAGDSLPVPIRFAPASFGAKFATLTIASNDPAGPQTISVSGDSPAGRLVVTGSTCFGAVQACCSRERTISICNVGDCKLDVTGVAFKRKSPFWKLINNPFPATLHPGSCLSVVIRYKAAERCARCCELVITSDDPATPVKVLELIACTIWDRDCGKNCCEDCRKGSCEKRPSDRCCGDCHDCCDDGYDGDEKDCGE